MSNTVSKEPAMSAEQEQSGTHPANSPAAADRSPLAELVSNHLRAKGLRQIDFCRQTGFDQGLLSKILSSVVTTLNIESALKLAEGMNLPPSVVFEAIGKKEADAMLRRLYSNQGGLIS
jgi:transcriptional regulator with XRE-family HTH domain